MTLDVLRQFAGLTPAQVQAVLDRMSPADLVALQERVPRTAVRRDPAAGGPAEFATSIDATFRTPAHVALLSDAIKRTVEGAIAGTGTGRLIVSMPPRVGKSTMSSIMTPAWFLERYPDRQVILATHDSPLSTSFGRKVRDLIGRNAGALQARLAQGVAAASEWETTLGGGMLSRGIGGSITGRGGHLFLIDDPIKDFRDAHSPAHRQAQWEWLLSTALTRLEPGAAVVVVATRWHEDDLIGRLLSPDWEGDPDEWEMLRLPALADEPDDPLGRAEGEPLTIASVDETPGQAVERWEKIRRSTSSYLWHGMYQQAPREPDGTILKRDWWRWYTVQGGVYRVDGDDIPRDRLRISQSWDLAFTDKASSDFVVGQVWGQHGARRLLLDQVRARLDFPATKSAMRALHAKWPETGPTWVENKANGPALIAELRKEITGLLPHDPKDSKVQRVYAVQPQIESGSVWLPRGESWVTEFIDEAAHFPTGKHDDQVDAMTQALIRMSSTGRGGMASPLTTRIVR